MANMGFSADRILAKLDEYLNKNDYASAKRHLLYWLGEATQDGNVRIELMLRNELMGLYRKLGERENALECVKLALAKIEEQGIEGQVGAATTFLNCATVYKAFGMPEDSLPLFERARDIYERELDANDNRLAGLYNNMALTLVDLEDFEAADGLYRQAISILKKAKNGELEIAITYLNMASAAESRVGAIEAESQIDELLRAAQDLLDRFEQRDGYYAFVCEKCASVFGYFGWFAYESELLGRVRRIYGE